MSTITDDDLSMLVAEAASSYDVPEHGPDEVLAALAAEPARPAVLRRRWVQLSAAAAVVTAGVAFAVVQHGGDTPSTKMTAASGDNRALTYGKSDAATTDGDKAVPAPAGADTTRALDSQKTATFATSGSAASGGGANALAPAAQPQAAAGRVPLSAGATAPQAPSLTGAVTAPVDEGDGRVVKSGAIALVVKDKRVTPTLTAVTNAAKSYGGYVSSGTSDEYGDTPSGEVTLRVPVTHFEDLVNKVRGLDAKVRTASTSGKDVTAQYSDLDAQLRTLTATRDRFMLILSKTKTISEILTVQQRVDTVSGQIDRIEGQRKLLANQSDLSTLTVSVSEEGDPVVKATTKPRSGISQAFSNAVDGFVSGVEAIISHSGRAILWLLCLGALLVFARGGWRVARRRMV